jgi:hypothetical protein
MVWLTRLNKLDPGIWNRHVILSGLCGIDQITDEFCLWSYCQLQGSRQDVANLRHVHGTCWLGDGEWKYTY